MIHFHVLNIIRNSSLQICKSIIIYNYVRIVTLKCIFNKRLSLICLCQRDDHTAACIHRIQDSFSLNVKAPYAKWDCDAVDEFQSRLRQFKWLTLLNAMEYIPERLAVWFHPEMV